jgi:hypothetical protein
VLIAALLLLGVGALLVVLGLIGHTSVFAGGPADNIREYKTVHSVSMGYLRPGLSLLTLGLVVGIVGLVMRFLPQ